MNSGRAGAGPRWPQSTDPISQGQSSLAASRTLCMPMPSDESQDHRLLPLTNGREPPTQRPALNPSPHPASLPVAPPPPQTETSHHPAPARPPHPVPHRRARPETGRPHTCHPSTKAPQPPPVDQSCRSQPPTPTPPPRSRAASYGQHSLAARQRGGRPPASRPSLWAAVRAPLPAASTSRPLHAEAAAVNPASSLPLGRERVNPQPGPFASAHPSLHR